MKSFLAAGLALVACVACAAKTENFNSMSASETPIATGDWAGGIVEANTADDNVLAIDGKVSCSNATDAVSSEFVKTSFMVKAPSEGTTDLPKPSSEELANCQIAVATGEATSDGAKVKVKVYSGSGSSPNWTDSGITVPTGELFTVSLNFNYMTKKVKVAINGAFAENTYDLVTAPANDATAAKINSLSFVGLSKIDDVKIAEACPKSHLAASLDGLEIYPEDILPVTADNIADDGDANAIKSVAAGLTPTTDPVDFYATSLATVTESETLKTVVTVPCNKDFGQVYNIVVDDGTQTTRVGVSEVEVGAIESDSRALKFVMPANNNAKVLKFHVEVGGPDGATNNS